MGLQFQAPQLGEVNINMQSTTDLINQAKNVQPAETLDIMKYAGQALQISKQQADADKIVQSNSAKQDYYAMIMDPNYRESSDTLRAEKFEEKFSTLEEGSAYANAFTSYASSEYINRVDRRQTETNNALYNSAGASYTSWLDTLPTDEQGIPSGYSNRELHKGPDAFVDSFVSDHPTLEKVNVGRAVLAEKFQGYEASILGATDTKDLVRIQSDIAEDKAMFDTPMFLGTKEKKGVEYVNALQTSLGNSIKGKISEFKTQSYGRLAQATQGGYRTLPSLVEADINATAGNALAAEKQKQEYVKKHVERTTADNYNNTYAIGDRVGALPEGNKLLKDERQAAVTKVLNTNFVSDNATEFVRVADNEQGMSKKIGEGILIQFNKLESAEDLEQIMTRLNNINEIPKGATVLRQMFTDTEYARMMSIKNMAMADPNRTMSENRAFVDKTSQSLYDFKLEPSANAKMLSYATGLGKQASNYRDVITRMLQINPQMADEQYKEIAKRFSDTVNKNSAGLTEDTSMSLSPSQGRDIINPDQVDKDIMAAMPEGTASIAHLPGGRVVAFDNLSGTISVVDVNKVTKDSESNTTNSLIAEQEGITEAIKSSPIVGAKVALKSFARTIIDNITSVPAGALEVGGDLVDVFQAHLFDSMSEGQQEFFKGWKPNQAKEFISSELISVLDDKIASLPTELDEVPINTLDETTQSQLPYALAANKAKVMSMGKILDSVVGVPSTVIQHITSREGSRSASYKDSLGNLTGGTGHLLTDEEKKLYPKGTEIPEEVRTRWVRQDSKKAYTAAKDQAEDLGITSEHFVKALASVNFQLGTQWKKKFPSAYKALKRGDYETAIQEIQFTKKGSGIKSSWSKQTPIRVKDFIGAIRQL